MITIVCAIWSVIGVGVIFLAIWGAICKSIEAKISNDDDIMSIKKRLFTIEEKLDLDSDDY